MADKYLKLIKKRLIALNREDPFNNNPNNAMIAIDKMVGEYERHLEDGLKTIADINKFISAMYEPAAKTQLASRRTLADEGFGRDLKWDIITISPNKNDCLIHSVLTLISEPFQKLKLKDKNEFADFFRRSIFLNLPVARCYQRVEEPEVYEAFLNRVKTESFLQENELFLLASQFKFRVLTAADRETTGKQFNLIDGNTLQVVLPIECCEWESNARWPLYCIYNQMTHYEAVRGPSGFDISEEDAAIAMSGLNNSTSHKSCKKCTYNNPKNSKVCQMCRSKLRGGTRKRGRRGRATRRT